MARPTIYNEEILLKTTEYIDTCKDIEIDNKLIKAKIPTIEGLARYLGINKDTVYTWRKEKLEFSELIEDLLAEQADRLVNNGLTGSYNPTIAKVLLSKHGYREGIEQMGKEGKDLIPETLTNDEIAKLKTLL
jgi:hypothetical protein